MQSSLRLTAFDSIELVLSIRAHLKILMTSGSGESKMTGRTYPTGTDRSAALGAALGAAQVSPLEPLAARVLAWGLVPITKHAFSQLESLGAETSIINVRG